MRSYNKSQSRRPEANFESEFANRVKKGVKYEAEQTGKAFWEQILGADLSTADSQTSEENSNNLHTESAKAEKSPKRPKEKGVIFEIKSQLVDGLFDDEGSSSKQENKNEKSNIEAAIDYHAEIAKSGERSSRRESSEISGKIQELMAELKKLAQSTKELQREFGHVTVESAPAKPGTYHLNFFEWMIIMLKQARQKVEDSNSWLSTVSGKSKKLGYWGSAKKFGTSFTQNNERNVATSTG